jgi:hypothetical protein
LTVYIYIYICNKYFDDIYFSKKMVGFWTCGDIFKTGYFIVRKAPPQFWICGIFQVSIDISIFIQVFIYRNLAAKAAKS